MVSEYEYTNLIPTYVGSSNLTTSASNLTTYLTSKHQNGLSVSRPNKSTDAAGAFFTSNCVYRMQTMRYANNDKRAVGKFGAYSEPCPGSDPSIHWSIYQT